MSPRVDPARRAAELRESIRRHDRLYYVEGEPAISDAEYDRLFRELQELEAAHPDLLVPDSPTQRVGARLPEGSSFDKVEHAVPMLSIDSLFDEDEVREYEERIVRFLKLGEGTALDWSVEPKFDGVSAALVYRDGVLVQAVTRGDGRVGEDVTNNLRTVRNVPLRLADDRRPVPVLLEVRGEVLIEREAFGRFNLERQERGEPVLANPRNATAGAVRRNDPAEVARYPLEYHVWAVARCEGAEFETHSGMLAALRDWGLPDEERGRVVRGIDACIAYHDELEAERLEIPFDVDGIVAKLDSLALRDRLGRTARATRWQFAHKFAPLEARTTLRAIEVQVGATGRLTPRAHLDPVEVSGVVVRHATLHNAEHVAALGLHVGDEVFVHRAGDVIPQIAGVATEAKGRAPKGWRDGVPEALLGEDGEPRAGVTWEWHAEFKMPESCPACGEPTVEEGKYWFCVNGLDCPPQLTRRIEVMVGRSAFEIDRLGPKLIQQLIDHGLLTTPADLFHLEREPLLELERWGEKSVDNLFEQIEQRRRVPLDRFLVALGLGDVGPATARLLARNFGTLDAVREATEEDLVAIDGIGPEVASRVEHWFAEERNRELLDRLFAGGIELVEPEGGPSSDALAGKSFVLTGTLEHLSRAEAKRLVEDLGGRVSSSVSAKTDFLVAGDKPGTKLEKAEELGVQVLDEAAFRALAGDSDGADDPDAARDA